MWRFPTGVVNPAQDWASIMSMGLRMLRSVSADLLPETLSFVVLISEIRLYDDSNQRIIKLNDFHVRFFFMYYKLLFIGLRFHPLFSLVRLLLHCIMFFFSEYVREKVLNWVFYLNSYSIKRISCSFTVLHFQVTWFIYKCKALKHCSSRFRNDVAFAFSLLTFFVCVCVCVCVCECNFIVIYVFVLCLIWLITLSLFTVFYSLIFYI